MSTTEALGRLAGGLLAPLAAVGSKLRGARVLHPEGVVFLGELTPLSREGPLELVAARLCGEALVRCSAALWRGREWKDVLGLALRLGDDPAARPRDGDQDLLFATVRSPWTLPFAPLATRQHDFLANDYFAVSPLSIPGLGRAYLRLVGSRAAAEGRDRAERLDRAVSSGKATFTLECKTPGRPPAQRWTPLATLRLLRRIQPAPVALRFDPFLAGRGVAPVGFVHSLRKLVYPASRFGSPRH